MIPMFARSRARASNSSVTPAPVSGWDTSENWSEMPKDRAIRLINYFPEADRITLRKGTATHASGLPGRVETLLIYIGLDGVAEIFAASQGAIYDVTDVGAVGAAVVSSLTNSKFEFVNFGTLGGQFLVAVNGDDTPLLYDGVAWSTTSITGTDSAEFIWVQAHQRRLWFGYKNSLTVYYLDIDSIGGVATPFYLGGVAQKGGYIQAMGTWTRDSGAGPDDVAVFATSEGELLVYNGTDPASISTWGIVGVYNIGRPIGRRCFVKLGGDLVFLSDSGILPMSQATLRDTSQQNLIAYSSRINDAFSDAVVLHGTTFGWQPIVYSLGHMLIVNVPISTTTASQYVFNTLTGAACQFAGLNAICWGTANGRMFYGSPSGLVVEYGIGGTDNGEFMDGEIITSFQYFSSPGLHKVFKRVAPIFISAAYPGVALQVHTDFNIERFRSLPIDIVEGQSRWGVAHWGIAHWGSRSNVWKEWRMVEGKGTAAALHIKTRTKNIDLSLMSIKWVFTQGGTI